MADRIGQQLGKYRLIRLLGQGGFAEVYLGEHLRLGTQAAVKILYTRLANPHEVESFEKEARTIAHLNHPHIVRVFDFDVQDDTPFLVMDYAPSGSLRQHHPKGVPLPLPTILPYVKQVAGALQYAHDQRLIHRDVKPENMLVGQREELLLSDFGIATVAQSSRYQGIEEMTGTMAYMAPEQIQGKPRLASDQYALGVVVYEWLSGTRPFEGSLTEIVAQHLAVPPASLRESISTIPPAIEQVVLRALAKDPKERFASVQAFADALEQAWQTEQTRGDAPTVLGTLLSPPVSPTGESLPSDSMPTLLTATEPTSFTPTLPASPDKVTEPTVPVVSTPAPVPVTPIPEAVSTPEPLSTREITQLVLSTTETDPSLLSAAEMTPLPISTIETAPSISSLSTAVVAPKRGVSRRTVLLGIAGLVVAGGGLTWLVGSRTFHASPSHAPSPSPQASPPPVPTLRPTSVPTPTPHPTPTPLPTAMPTLSPSPFSVPPLRPTSVPTPTPHPTPTHTNTYSNADTYSNTNTYSNANRHLTDIRKYTSQAAI